jgi:hypothetical protein
MKVVTALQDFWHRLRELKLSCVQVHDSSQAAPDPGRQSFALRRSFDPARQTSVLRRYFDASQLALLTHLVSMLTAVSRLDIADVELNVPVAQRVQTMGALTKTYRVCRLACPDLSTPSVHAHQAYITMKTYGC